MTVLAGRESGVARFSEAELDYLLGESRLGRLATIDMRSGHPHVVPVGWRYDHGSGAIEISGRDFARTRKYRNAQADPRVAFIVDDVLPPWRPRCVMVQGRVEPGPRSDGAGSMLRVFPEKIVSWGLDHVDS